MSAESGIRRVSTTSTQTSHPSSRRSTAMAVSGRRPVSAWISATAALAASAGPGRLDRRRGRSDAGPSATVHQALYQRVLPFGALLGAQRAGAAGLIEHLQLGPDPGGIVVLG